MTLENQYGARDFRPAWIKREEEFFRAVSAGLPSLGQTVTREEAKLLVLAAQFAFSKDFIYADVPFKPIDWIPRFPTYTGHVPQGFATRRA